MLRAVERLVGAAAAALVGLVGMLDLDHVGAEHGELVGRERPGQHVRDVDHPDALERSRHPVSSLPMRLPDCVASRRLAAYSMTCARRCTYVRQPFPGPARRRAEGTNMRTGSISSYVVVASCAAILSVAVTSAIRTSQAQPTPAAPAVLLTQPLSDLPGREVRISLLDRAPQASSPPHRHPGHHTFGYVVEGTTSSPSTARRRGSSRPARFLRAAGCVAFGVAQSEQRRAHQDPRLHGGGSEEPEHRRAVSATWLANRLGARSRRQSQA